uniref:(northern house mosquito) hypothetical protein n=1 Tax=Culex pipiens TaxID=7175 RepID=A0A8D8KI71_CULPI
MPSKSWMIRAFGRMRAKLPTFVYVRTLATTTVAAVESTAIGHTRLADAAERQPTRRSSAASRGPVRAPSTTRTPWGRSDGHLSDPDFPELEWIPRRKEIVSLLVWCEFASLHRTRRNQDSGN